MNENSSSTSHLAAAMALIGTQVPTMSSLEIAERTGKQHGHVMRDIRNMLSEMHGEGGVSKFGDTHRNPQNGQEYPIFRLPQHECLTLVTGYSVPLRSAVLARWAELEREANDPATAIQRALGNPSAMRGLLLGYTERVIELEGQVAEMAPQVQALERIAVSDGSLCITDAAKTLQIGPRALFRYLREQRWIYARIGTSGDVAYQARLISGDLEHKTTTVLRPDGTEKTVTQVRVTPKGLTKLAKLLPPVAAAA
jgi:phage antirepressor YoqD-like protein/phage regulator Rha-like protein